MRHYGEADLKDLVPLEQAMDALERAFLEHRKGAALVQPRVSTDLGSLRVSTMAAIIPHLAVCGAKVYTALGGPHGTRLNFVVLLFSTLDGRALASFDAGELTRLRTAAVSALAAQRLARADSSTLVVFGTGTQAAGHAQALAAILPIREILVVGRGGAAAFAAEVESGTGVRTAVSDARTAVPKADVIVTATRSLTPLFEGSAIAEGCCVIGVGACRPDAAELDAATLRRASVLVTDGLEQAEHEAGNLLAAASAGVPVWERLIDLGAILSGAAPGRRTRSEITVFESLGFALEDIAVAALAYTKLHPD